MAVQQRAKLSLHVQPLRAAVGRPGCLLRVCASCCLPCFASLALPGLFSGPQACFRYICPAACLTALLSPFVTFLRCLSQYVPPPAALRLLCLPLLPCSAFLKRKGCPASCRELLRCFAACFGPALLCAYGLKTKAARLCSASLPYPKEGRGSASLCLRCLSLRLSKNVAQSAFIEASDSHGLRPWLH